MGLHLIRGSGKTERPIALLDLGSSKVSCLIVSAAGGDAGEARVGAPLPARKLGFGLTRSRGIRAGSIIDLIEAEEAVKQAVGLAEAEAGIRVEEVVVAVTSGRLKSLNFAASTAPAGGTVANSDVDKILAAGQAFAERDGRKLLHLQRLGFRLDGQIGIRNPRGMPGERLSLDLNAVTADEVALRNIRMMLGRSYLKVATMVAAPFASALATLAEEDLQAGTIVVDMGAGTTTYAVFREGMFQHAGGIAIGGHQVTLDIARALAIPFIQAERIKALYGNLVGAMSDEHEYVPLTPVRGSAEGELRLTRAQLRRALAPRVDEVLQLVRERLSSGGLGMRASERVVLTGGGSQLAGLGDTASRHFGCRVRLGRPGAITGLEPAIATPGLAALLGLAFAVLVPGALGRVAGASPASPAGYAGRLGRWFKDSFWDDELPADAGSA